MFQNLYVYKFCEIVINFRDRNDVIQNKWLILLINGVMGNILYIFYKKIV